MYIQNIPYLSMREYSNVINVNTFFYGSMVDPEKVFFRSNLSVIMWVHF